MSKKKISALSSKSKKIKKTIAKLRRPFSARGVLTVNNNLLNQGSAPQTSTLPKKNFIKKDENIGVKNLRSSSNGIMNIENNKKKMPLQSRPESSRNFGFGRGPRFLEDSQKNIIKPKGPEKENKGRLVFCVKGF
jgi:hypothetical protein